jgi:hypothetical protein
MINITDQDILLARSQLDSYRQDLFSGHPIYFYTTIVDGLFYSLTAKEWDREVIKMCCIGISLDFQTLTQGSLRMEQSSGDDLFILSYINGSNDLEFSVSPSDVIFRSLNSSGRSNGAILENVDIEIIRLFRSACYSGISDNVFFYKIKKYIESMDYEWMP